MAGNKREKAMRPTRAAILLLASLTAALPAQSDSLPHPKSPRTALLLSLGATVVPYAIAEQGQDQNTALAVAAILVGPAVGHFYAGKPGRGLVGMGIRVGVTAVTVGVAQLACHDPQEWSCLGATLAFTGAAVLGSMVVDIAAAPGSARRSNEERARLAILPLRGGAHPRLGIGVRLGF
jgi:hypothetical protein